MHITKSVLIVGGSGYLGTHLALRLREHYKVIATYNEHQMKIEGVSCVPLRLADKNYIKRLVYSTRPDVIIYVAGNNSVEWSDRNAQLSEKLHVFGTATVANMSDVIQPKFIYISNPYVFDGFRGNYHTEDTVLPGTVLGRVKNGAENVVRGRCLNYIILRLSPVLGRGNGLNQSLLDGWRMKFSRGERFEVGYQEIHSFSPAEGFCELVERIIESGIKNRVVHYGGLTKLTHFELAQQFASRFGYDPGLVSPKRYKHRKTGITDEFVFDFSLNSTETIQLLKIKPFLLEECFDLIEQKLITHLRT